MVTTTNEHNPLITSSHTVDLEYPTAVTRVPSIIYWAALEIGGQRSKFSVVR